MNDKTMAAIQNQIKEESPIIFIKHHGLRTVYVQAMPGRPCIFLNLILEDPKHPGDFHKATSISMALDDEVIDLIRKSIHNYRCDEKEEKNDQPRICALYARTRKIP